MCKLHRPPEHGTDRLHNNILKKELIFVSFFNCRINVGIRKSSFSHLNVFFNFIPSKACGIQCQQDKCSLDFQCVCVIESTKGLSVSTFLRRKKRDQTEVSAIRCNNSFLYIAIRGNLSNHFFIKGHKVPFVFYCQP